MKLLSYSLRGHRTFGDSIFGDTVSGTPFRGHRFGDTVKRMCLLVGVASLHSAQLVPPLVTARDNRRIR